jgi:hypothetical protein
VVWNPFGSESESPEEGGKVDLYRLEVYGGSGPAVPYEICPDGFNCRARLETATGELFYFFDDHQHQRGKALGIPEDCGGSKQIFLPTSLLTWAISLAELGRLKITNRRGRKMLTQER